MKKNLTKIFLSFALVTTFFIANNVHAGAPLAPTGVRAEAGDSSAKVYFTPDPTTFDPTVKYIATTVVSGPALSYTGESTTSPITVSGLTNGQSYKFVVRAKNTSGTSANSGESNVVVPVASGSDTVDNTNVPPPSGGSNLDIKIRYVNPLQAQTVEDFIAKVIDSAVLLLTPIIVIMLIWTGFLFITARGNPESLATAKKALLYVIIGATIILIAKGFSLAIRGVFSQF